MLRPLRYVFPSGTPLPFRAVNWAAVVTTMVAIGLGLELAVRNTDVPRWFLAAYLPILVAVWCARTVLLVWYGRQKKAFRKD